MRMGYRTVSLSYRHVYDLARKIALFLERSGVKKGDRILLMAPNSPYWICVFWGALLKGAVLVPLNTQSTPEMVRRIANQTGAKILFKSLYIHQDFPGEMQIFDLELLKETVADLDISRFREADARESDLVEILYTSGTTGDPKGVVLTHKNLFSNVETVSKLIPLSERDKFLSILPLSHVLEQMAGFLIPFGKGCTIVYAHSPAVIGDLLNEYRISAMVAVPEFLQVLMRKIEEGANRLGTLAQLQKMFAFSAKLRFKPLQRLFFRPVLGKLGGRLRIIASGGAPLDPELEKKWEALGIHLLQGYGLTETAPILSVNRFFSSRLGTVGPPIPGVELKIAPDGEILAKGPNVFGEYFKDEGKTVAAFTEDGWFKTDDLGAWDEKGFLRIKGRKKYVILGPSGQNVYPEDIESEINRVPGARDSCVVGLQKPGGRIRIHAVLLLASEASGKAGEIVAAANKKLASYQQIQAWSVWPKEDFPRSLTRKVQKEEVIEWLKKKEEGARPRDQAAKSPLAELLADITGLKAADITGKTTMSDLNLDSLLRVELVARIGDNYRVEVEESRIISTTTVAELSRLIRSFPALRKKHFSDWPIAWWARALRFLLRDGLFFPLAKLFVRLEVEGLENLRGLPTPLIFMPNHLSYLDSVAVAMALPFRIRRRIAFAAAVDVLYEEYGWISAFVQLLMNTFRFPRRERESIQYGLEYTGRRLDQGYNIVVFPEGKMSENGKPLPLKRGAGLMAVEMDAMVIPVKIDGTAQVIPYAKIFPRRHGKVTIKFGKPLHFSRADSYIEATEAIQNSMKSP